MNNPTNIREIDYEIILSFFEYLCSVASYEKAGEVLRHFKNLYIPHRLYKFYSLYENEEEVNEKKIKTLRNGKAYLSRHEKLNDPFEARGYYFDKEKIKPLRILRDSYERIIDIPRNILVQSSFTSNDQNTSSMWAHYSNNYKGYCVAYNMDIIENLSLKNSIFKVQYVDHKINITDHMNSFFERAEKYLAECEKKGLKNIDVEDISLLDELALLINVKHKSWEYENEFKCLCDDRSFGEYIQAIPETMYIGMNCKENYKKELILAASELNIPAYVMKPDYFSSEFELIREENKT